MRFLRSFNKALITVAAAAVICALLLGDALLGQRVAAVDVIVSAPERSYTRPPSRFAEFIHDDFLKIYWAGDDIWRPEYTQRLPVPQVKAPEPRPDDLPAPLFRPGPATDAYLKILGLKAKYPCLVPGAPAIPEAEAPPAAEIEGIKKLEEPPVKPKADRRAERERENYTLELTSGARVEGQFLDKDAVSIQIKNVKTGQREKYPLAMVKKELPNWTNEEKYQKEARAIKPGPQESQDRLKLALWCYDEIGMVQEAEAEAKQAIEKKKDAAEGYLLLGRIYFEQGNFDAAMATYEAGIAAGAYAPDLHYEIGRICRTLAPLEEHWLEAAQTAFERALEASPRHQKSKVARARTLLDRGQARAAADEVSDFFVKLGSSPDTRVPEKVEGYLVRGTAMIRQGDAEKARSDLAEALKLLGPYLETLKAPPAPEATPHKPPAAPPAAEALKAAEAQNAEALNAQAVLDALDGKYGPAGAGFIAVIKAQQYHIDAWTNLGTLLLLAGRWADAEAVYAGAAQRDPISAEALLGIGLAQAMGGKPAEGVASIEKALKIEPRHAGARAALGYLKLRTAGMDDAALDSYREALRHDYSYMPACYGASIAFLRAARKAKAEAETEKDETRAQELSHRARESRLYAETLLQRLKAFDPARADTLVALGCVYALLDRPDEAHESLRAAAQILQQNQKGDPLLHFVIGYVEYWFPASDPDEKRLDKAMASFTRSMNVEIPPQDAVGAQIVADAKKAVEDIADWKVTSLRLDERFEREADKSPGNAWLENESNGIDITLDTSTGQGRCRFSGQQIKSDMGITMLDRQIPSENFYALELTLYPLKVQGAEFGASIYTSAQGNTRIGFHVGFNDKGKAFFNPTLSYPNDMDMKDMGIVKWNEIKVPLPDPAQVTMRVTRSEKDRRPIWNIYWWDPAKNEWILAQKEISALAGGPPSKTWIVSFWGRALRGQAYTLDLDNVRIYERTRR